MKYFSFALILIAFFALIAFACWHFDSMLPLLFIFITPSLKEKDSKNDTK